MKRLEISELKVMQDVHYELVNHTDNNQKQEWFYVRRKSFKINNPDTGRYQDCRC